jgi:predicted transcriptional regulator
MDPQEPIMLRGAPADSRRGSLSAEVRKGAEQADRGEFIEEPEMDARVERMLRR